MLRDFPRVVVRENTQLSPSFTQKPCMLNLKLRHRATDLAQDSGVHIHTSLGTEPAPREHVIIGIYHQIVWLVDSSVTHFPG